MRNTSLAIVFATVCVDLLGFGLVMPLLPIYGRELLKDYSPGQQGALLGVLMSCFSMMQFVFAPVWGRVSDRIGRRPVLLLSLAGSTFFYTVFGFATQQRSLLGMFLSRIGAGIAAATIPTAQAYIADATPREHRARGMALIGAAFGLGFTLGPLIGVAALAATGDDTAQLAVSPWPGYVASGLSALALLVALFKLPESPHAAVAGEARPHFDLASFRDALMIPSIGLLLLTGFLAVFSLADYEGTISLAIAEKLGMPGERLDLKTLLLVFACIGVVQCVIQGGLVRQLAKRMSDARLAVIGALLSIAGFALLALAMNPEIRGTAFLVLASAVEIAGVSFAFSAVPSLVSRRSDPAKQGAILGISESISSVARITGVPVGLMLFKSTIGPPLSYWAAGGMMVAALVLVLVAIGRGRDWEEKRA